METFISFIKQYITLSKEAEESITRLALKEYYSKGDLLLEEGKTCQRFYYLSSGSARTYHYQNGKDITYWIYPESSIITSWNSYLTQQPSSEYLETINESVLISLSYNQWQELYIKHPELERFGRLILEEQMALLDSFYRGYYFMSAKEKYSVLIYVFPTITQIANLGHIASMLGISQETLSRIRGK